MKDEGKRATVPEACWGTDQCRRRAGWHAALHPSSLILPPCSSTFLLPPSSFLLVMKPTIVLVGRPNVGKSTLFNRMTRSRQALVADISGLTRDRHYGHGNR